MVYKSKMQLRNKIKMRIAFSIFLCNKQIKYEESWGNEELNHKFLADIISIKKKRDARQ